jgi:hypothetical protein
VLLSMLVSTAAMPQAVPELETIFKAQGIDKTSVIYRDEHGKTITEQAFAYVQKHPRQSVLAVTFDDAATARNFVAAHGFSWPVLVDGMAFHEAMGVNAYPTMALVGPDDRLLNMALSSKIEGKPDAMAVADLERWIALTAVSTQPQRQP